MLYISVQTTCNVLSLTYTGNEDGDRPEVIPDPLLGLLSHPSPFYLRTPSFILLYTTLTPRLPPPPPPLSLQGITTPSYLPLPISPVPFSLSLAIPLPPIPLLYPPPPSPSLQTPSSASTHPIHPGYYIKKRDPISTTSTTTTVLA